MTIIYSIVGIPMMALCLKNLGESEAKICRILYIFLMNLKNKKQLILKGKVNTDSIQSQSPSYVNLGAKNLVVRSNESLAQDIFLIENLNSMQTNLVLNEIILEKNTTNQAKSIKTIKLLKKKNNNECLTKLDKEDDACSVNNSIECQKVRVPISLTLFILSSYIFTGGILFMVIEDWSLLDGIYFSFITLSTIGLGDFVPGNSINDSNSKSQFKIIGCSLYLIIGLSLLVMGFNLMQETILAKIHKLGACLGIMDASKK